MRTMRRAEALAAVALVVGARQEPVAALRRLAAEDAALRVLTQVAQQIKQGESLPDALVACRLLLRRDAAHLVGIAPVLLADELTRLAQHAAAPPTGEVLARWFPVWAVLAATVPSLLIGAVVALVGGALYGGVWQSLGISQPTSGPAFLWFIQVAEVAVAVLLIAGIWWGLQQMPFFRLITIFSHRLNRAMAAADLVRQARSGADATSALGMWTRRSGDAKAVRQAIAASGGDATTTLMRLGVVPRNSDGRPDWDVAVAETEHVRTQAAQGLAPWLIAVLVLSGIHGFTSWELEPFKPIFNLMHDLVHVEAASLLLLKRELTLIANAGGAVLLAHLFMQLGWCDRWLRGPACDWPLVADRLARGIDRHEDPDHVLRGLRLAVAKPMRRRIDVALLANTNSRLGARLAHANIAPRTLANTLSIADSADLPTLLRSSAPIHADHGLQAATSQAGALVTLALLLAVVQLYLLVGIIPKFREMFRELNENFYDIPALAQWASNVSLCALLVIVTGGMITAWGHRRGWWIAGGDWARLARGLVLRRLLATGANEATLARTLTGLVPQQAARLAQAAQHGDLPSVLAAAGWSVQTAADLDRAVTNDLMRRERRRAHLALTARILLPFLVGLPVGLTVASVGLSLSRMTHAMIEIAAGRTQGGPLPCGGTPGLALIYWWTTRCEEQGDEAIEQIRANRIPEKTPFKPRPEAPKQTP